MKQKICFIGAGYIGGSTCPVMAYYNPDVDFTVVDINISRIDAWNSDKLPIYEPGLDEIVKKTRGKNLFFSTDIKTAVQESDIIFIGVNTPTKMYGEGAGEASDLTYWEGAARTIANFATTPKIIVEKSTLPVKTAYAIKRLLDQLNSNLKHVIVSNPEFLAEGSAINDLMHPDRILIGAMQNEAGKDATQKIAALYRAWVPEEKILTTNLWSSELSKLTANAMLAQRVSSINAIASVCEEVDADVSEVAKAVGMDNRIGSKFLKAGPGFGGSCFKKDILNLVYICRSLGLDYVADYWKSVIEMNDMQQKRIVQRILKKSFNTLSNKHVCVLGYAFKANTDDTRETPAKFIVQALKDEHCSRITIYDPKASENSHREVDDGVCMTVHDPYLAVELADIVIVCTDWDEFKTLDWKRVHSLMVNQRLVFDARNYLDHDMLKELGFDVMSVGKMLDDNGDNV